MQLTFDQVAKSHDALLRVSVDGGSTWTHVRVHGDVMELGSGPGVIVFPEVNTTGRSLQFNRHSVRAITESNMKNGAMIIEEVHIPEPRALSYGVLSG